MKRRLPLAVILALTSLSVVAAVAPGPPQNLEVSVNGTSVALTWKAPSVGGVPDAYIVDASLSPSGPVIASFGVAGTTMSVTDVPHGVYYARVHASNADGQGPASNEVVIAVPGDGSGCNSAPNRPEALTGSATSNLVTLSWSPPSGACSASAYSVQAGSSPGASDVAVINVGPATTLSASAPSGIYYVRVVALNAFGGSPVSDELIVTVGCPAPPNAPMSLTGASVGTAVALNWAAASSGCTPAEYEIHAGSAPGLSDLAILNVGGATSLSVSAPAGTYYVRVVASNDVGASAASNEIIVNVVASSLVRLTFNGLADGSPIVSHTESGFTIMPTTEDWSVSTTIGNPAPFIQFFRQANEDTVSGEVTVTAGGALFTFASVDVYSSLTPIPVEIVGLRDETEVFRASGTVPRTFGAFATVNNTSAAAIIDTLVIRVTNPATACCSNPVGLDNIAVVR
jgi:hypothetical protein